MSDSSSSSETPASPGVSPSPSSSQPVSTGSHRVPQPNQAALDEMNKAETLCLKAQKAEYSGPLAARDISAALLTATLTKIQQARAVAALGTQATTGRQTVTQSEENLRKDLLKRLNEIQKAAKQKARLTPLNLDDYFVGVRLDESRARLVQLAGQVLAKAGTADLPGITPLKLGQAATILAEYKNIETAQSDAQSDATDSRSDLKTMVREITNVRIAIQLAADAEWPHGDPANAAERREFQLPPNRPLKG